MDWLQTDERSGRGKQNDAAFDLQARIMFEGEMEGLKALGATGIVTVPRPINVFDHPDGGACLVMDFIEMKGLRSLSSKLGEDLAKMHMQNVILENRGSRITDKPAADYVAKFGFHTTTCCGFIPQENEWQDDWVVSCDGVTIIGIVYQRIRDFRAHFCQKSAF